MGVAWACPPAGGHCRRARGRRAVLYHESEATGTLGKLSRLEGEADRTLARLLELRTRASVWPPRSAGDVRRTRGDPGVAGAGRDDVRVARGQRGARVFAGRGAAD